MEQVEIKLDVLADIIEELTARKISDKGVVQPYQYKSWNDLCDEGLRLFNELKKNSMTKR